MLHYQTVTPDLLSVLKHLMKLSPLQNFRLVGGTSLALQLDHRRSVDIDLFTEKNFDKDALIDLLKQEFKTFMVNWRNMNGFTSSIDQVKSIFFNWGIRFLHPPVLEDGLILMPASEIAATKLETITTRKTQKDFYDIACLRQQFSLKDMLVTFCQKYPYLNHKMVLESLMAPDYADETEQPKIFVEMTWNQVKQKVVEAVKQFFEEQDASFKALQVERLRRAEELLKQKKNKE